MVHWSKNPEIREEVRQKISNSRKGQGIGNSNGFKKGKSSWNKDLPKEKQPRYGKIVSQKQIDNCRKVGKLKTNPWNKGLNESIKIESNILRNEIYELRGNNCENCGISNEESKKQFGRRLDIHHTDKLYDNIKTRHKKGNLRILCRSCHQKWHIKKRQN